MGVETMPKGANGDRALLKCDARATFAVILDDALRTHQAFRRTVRKHAVAAWSAARQVKMEVLGERRSAQHYPPGSARLNVH